VADQHRPVQPERPDRVPQVGDVLIEAVRARQRGTVAAATQVDGEQALATLVPLSSEACWDWHGYTGPGYAIHGAPQMVTIMNMIHALRG
jgi:hypothetical protein